MITATPRDSTATPPKTLACHILLPPSGRASPTSRLAGHGGGVGYYLAAPLLDHKKSPPREVPPPDGEWFRSFMCSVTKISSPHEGVSSSGEPPDDPERRRRRHRRHVRTPQRAPCPVTRKRPRM